MQIANVTKTKQLTLVRLLFGSVWRVQLSEHSLLNSLAIQRQMPQQIHSQHPQTASVFSRIAKSDWKLSLHRQGCHVPISPASKHSTGRVPTRDASQTRPQCRRQCRLYEHRYWRTTTEIPHVLTRTGISYYHGVGSSPIVPAIVGGVLRSRVIAVYQGPASNIKNADPSGRAPVQPDN